MKKKPALNIILFLISIFLILWMVNAIYDYIFISEISLPDLLIRNVPLNVGDHRILFSLILTTIMALPLYFFLKMNENERRKKQSLENQVLQQEENLNQFINKLTEHKKLFESVKHPIIVLNENHICCMVNHSFLQFFTLEEIAVKDRHIEDIMSYPRLLLLLKEALIRAEKTDYDEFEISIFRKNQMIDFAISLYSSDGCSGNVRNYAVFFCDITERKKTERLKYLQKQQLNEAGKMTTLATLSAGMAHEINNPNNAILMNASLLQRIFSDIFPLLNHREFSSRSFGGFAGDKIEEKMEMMLNGILSGSERIKNITDELRDFARQDSGHYEKLDINDIMVSSLRKVDHLLEKKVVSINVELNKGRPIYTRGIFYKIEQVFSNLLINAYDSLSGVDNSMKIIVGIDQKIRKIVILINDTGCGMDEETLQHIRDPFFTTKRSTGSIGLGLSTTSRIIEEHGGTLDFISQPDSGTTAVIHFPLWEDLIN